MATANGLTSNGRLGTKELSIFPRCSEWFFPWCFSCWLFCRFSFDEKFDKKCLGEVGFIKTGDPTVNKGCHPKKLWQLNELSPFFVACHVLMLSPVRLFCAWVGVCWYRCEKNISNTDEKLGQTSSWKQKNDIPHSKSNIEPPKTDSCLFKRDVLVSENKTFSGVYLPPIKCKKKTKRDFIKGVFVKKDWL